MRSAAHLSKVSRRLAAELANSGDADQVDVVIELTQRPRERLARPSKRSELLADLKESFEAVARPVEQTVEEAGGQVQDVAWLNRTIRASLRADAIQSLNDHEAVVSIDAPQAIELES